ncbi:hypothetical protein BG000_009193 [Podila horticola]|nr:hypothetical protein BG000_009193 [Podila horticola]
MHFSFSSTTFLIAVAVAQLFAAPVQADSCDSDCSTVTSKLLNCGSSNVDFSTFPKLDIVMASCLCTTETISAFQGCENCRSIHKVVMSTDQLIADCNPSRTYVASNNANNIASSNTRSMANNRSSRVGAVVAIIAVGLAISLS